ncbi:hypothetical protein BJ741DRAFT_579879 [Chytriomyces cf. hyalinus JEL632]|nr:hypothetical protein BJ741DRAFT_579879 [Chytriomyces cf. hyalinus JEL632]
MFLELGIYLTAFTARFLGVTKSFYVSEGARWIWAKAVAAGSYSAHSEKRIDEEKMWWKIVHACVPYFQRAREYLQILWRLHCESRSFDRKRCEPRLILGVIAFKKRMENLTNTAFASSKEFMQVIRESFEKFINKRHNKPSELIAKHVDSLMKTGKGITETETEELWGLNDVVNAKEGSPWSILQEGFGKETVVGESSSVDSEKSMLSNLKVECGAAFTSKLENIFKDIETSKDFVTSFRESPRLMTQLGSVEVYVNFLTAGMWPTYPPAPLTIPAELSCTIHQYIWRHPTYFLRQRSSSATKELSVSLFQSAVLLLFNDKPVLSYAEILAATNMEPKELERTLQSLACGKLRVLTKEPKGRDVHSTDTFLFNHAFENPLFRIKINSIQMKETVEENKETTEKVFADRQYQVDAAIVRITKKERKKLPHALLIAELFEQLKFPIKAPDLKKRIESLIDREYLERMDRKSAQKYKLTLMLKYLYSFNILTCRNAKVASRKYRQPDKLQLSPIGKLLAIELCSPHLDPGVKLRPLRCLVCRSIAARLLAAEEFSMMTKHNKNDRHLHVKALLLQLSAVQLLLQLPGKLRPERCVACCGAAFNLFL